MNPTPSSSAAALARTTSREGFLRRFQRRNRMWLDEPSSSRVLRRLAWLWDTQPFGVEHDRDDGYRLPNRRVIGPALGAAVLGTAFSPFILTGAVFAGFFYYLPKWVLFGKDADAN